MGGFFTAILGKITGLAAWLIGLVKAAFLAVFDLAKDAVCWALDGFMGVAVGAANLLDVSALSSYASGMWSGLPGEVLNVLGLIGLGTALQIIGAALVIRFVLQTVPFVRWGS